MTAFKREPRLFMVKQRWPPLVAIVARGTVAPARAKLIGMWILMALAACGWRVRKSHVPQIQLHVGWLVAVGAANCAM